MSEHDDQDQAAEVEVMDLRGVDPARLITQLQILASENVANGTPTPFAHGTFAIYPTPKGGIMLVLDSPQAGGVSRTEVPAGMIRALAAFGGGGKFGAIKALFGKRDADAG